MDPAPLQNDDEKEDADGPRTAAEKALGYQSASSTLASVKQKTPSGLANVAKLKKFDWLTTPPPPNLPPFKQFIHDVDWTTSPLGPIAGWPDWLKRMVMLIVADPNPAVVYVDDEEGVENAIIYNESYPALIGSKGHDPKIGFAEIWSTFADILARGRNNFETVVGDAQPLLLFRHGFFEETWFSWKFTPCIGPGGYVVCSHATVIENTREVVLDRRAQTLQKIDQQVSGSKDIKDMWTQFAEATRHNGTDLPFVLVYSADVMHSQLPERERSPGPPTTSCSLEAGVGEGAFEMAPKKVDLTQDTGLGALMQEAMAKDEPQRFSIENLPTGLQSVFRSREYGEACTHGVVCPIQSPATKASVGFIVISQNIRRPWDEDYRDFISKLTKQTSSTANRLLLSEQLSRRTKEFKESEVRFSRFTTRAPMGLAIFSPDGALEYGNDYWYQLFQFSKESAMVDSNGEVLWLSAIHEDDRDKAWEAWSSVLSTKQPVTVEFRLTTPRKALDPDAPEGAITVLCSAFADMDAKGEVQSVMSCLTAISSYKQLEEQLRARTKDVETKIEHVLEMKRQQENFIDMTSHEIRNPLSAVLHLAEEISATSNDVLRLPALTGIPENELESITSALKGSIEAAETIAACVLHQKRIVDDILVLSRLDSELLTVTPVATQPQDLITSALKMFEAEVRTANMTLSFDLDQSLQDLNVEWLMFDPNRVIQILVNLVGNAIKFTKTQDVRNINVSMKASLSRPSDSASNIDFVPIKEENSMSKACHYEGDGEVVYLSLGVADTGQGLSQDEKKVLFQRFSQGSKRTHTKYGGSGLGLWISKQLTELHGGQIGFESEVGTGSNFIFFIKTRRTGPSLARDSRRSISKATTTTSEEILSQAAASRVLDLETHQRPLEVRPHSSFNKLSTSAAVPPPVHVVLVVEDNVVNSRIIVKQLRKQGYIVYTAYNGQEALDFLRTTVFWASPPPITATGATAADKGTKTAESAELIPLSIVLMDLEMPVLDGISAVKAIRKFEASGQINAHIPVLAVTANARGEQLEGAMRAGMDSSITKPYRLPAIIEKIQAMAFVHGSEP